MKERITNVLGVAKETLFTTREQAEAESAWEDLRGKKAMEAVRHMPIGDVEILLGMPEAKDRFLYERKKDNPIQDTSS